MVPFTRVKAVAEAFGYSAEELTSIPVAANMGLSCGNATATAHLRSGEVVVDLGSGGGLDVFLAAKMVGPKGRAIGIDMTTAMIERAKENAAKGGYTKVEFYQSTIDRIPLPDASVNPPHIGLPSSIRVKCREREVPGLSRFDHRTSNQSWGLRRTAPSLIFYETRTLWRVRFPRIFNLDR